MVRFGRVFMGACFAFVAAGLMAACGGNQSAPQNSGTVPPMMEVQKENAALPMAKAASIPRGLHCRGDIVWVNTAKKTYHDSTDPWYGRTKHGEYMCKAAANAEGYHMAGTRHSPKGGRNSMATPAPEYT